jgi:O-antigen/teichoic acid export membrane protein
MKGNSAELNESAAPKPEEPTEVSAALPADEESVLLASSSPADVGEVELAPQTVSAPHVAGARPLFVLVGTLAGGSVLAMTLRMTGGLIQARLVDPAVLGLFNSFGLILGYAPFLQLGVFNGLNREFPFFIGKGDREHGWQLAAVAQGWAFLLSGVICTALLAVAAWNLFQGNLPAAAGLAANAFLAFALFYTNYYLNSTYRTSGDFAKLAVADVANASVGLAMVALVALIGFYGICLRACLAAAVGMAILYHWRPVRIGPRWNFTHLTHLLKIGLPIFCAGQLYAYWSVLDQTLVLCYAGRRGLGLYALVLTVAGAVQLLPNALTQVLYPRLVEHFGRTNSRREAVTLVIKPMLATLLGMVPVVAMGWLLIGPVVSWILPKYVDAVPAIRWSMLVALLAPLGVLDHAFVLVKKQGMLAVVKGQGLLVAATAIGIAVYLTTLWLLTRKQVDLVDFPQAMLVGRATYIAAMYAILLYMLYRGRAGARS